MNSKDNNNNIIEIRQIINKSLFIFRIIYNLFDGDIGSIIMI
jgi:hypothetical protein